MPRRLVLNGTTRIPFCSISERWLDMRVTSTTSYPLRTASTAKARRCETKYQSSVTKNSNLGKLRVLPRLKHEDIPKVICPIALAAQVLTPLPPDAGHIEVSFAPQALFIQK